MVGALVIEQHDGYKLWVGGPVPPGYDGITLGSLIIVRRDCAHSEALIAHERVHVDQWRTLGAPRFLAQYLWSYVRSRLAGHDHLSAYRRIPLEVDACWNASIASDSTSLTRKRIASPKS